MTTMTPPAPDDYPSFYAGYVGKVPLSTGPMALLESQVAAFQTLGALPEASANHRYAEGKWTVKELVGHMADTERVFAYRLLRIARADETPMPGFDENAWAAAAPHASRTIADIAAELIAVRGATLALMRSLDTTALARVA